MKQSSPRLLICCLLGITIILSLSATALAQSGTGEVRGTVKDAERGDPLIGANVVLDGTNFGAAANIEGVYSVKGVPAGRYTLVVRYVGYRQQSKE